MANRHFTGPGSGRRHPDGTRLARFFTDKDGKQSCIQILLRVLLRAKFRCGVALKSAKAMGFVQKSPAAARMLMGTREVRLLDDQIFAKEPGVETPTPNNTRHATTRLLDPVDR
jgi:hypothetical protein